MGKTHYFGEEYIKVVDVKAFYISWINFGEIS